MSETRHKTHFFKRNEHFSQQTQWAQGKNLTEMFLV